MRTFIGVMGMGMWLGLLALAAAITLGLTSSRVGEHRSSTFGEAYGRFVRSWGGEIAVPPAEFFLERTYEVEEYDQVAKQFRPVEKIQQIPLVPESIAIQSTLDYGEQERDWLTFNAFMVGSREVYRVRNHTRYSGRLFIKTAKPRYAHIMYNYTVSVTGPTNRLMRPTGRSLLAADHWSPESEAEAVVQYGTKGMDIFKHDLSAYADRVIPELSATIDLNTPDFEVYRFGLPHEIQPTEEGRRITVEARDFATTQDLGVTFLSHNTHLDHMQSMMEYAVVCPAIFLFVVFVMSQAGNVRFHPLHYLFITMVHVFYFLFVAYLIRFLGVWVTLGIATVLTAVMTLVYFPGVFGRVFAARVAGVYLVLLTVVFSGIFLMPMFRGLLFLTLLFIILLSVMIRLGRTDVSTWPLVVGGQPEPAGA